MNHFNVRDWFYDKHGKRVIFQRPNLLIIGWAVSAILGHIFTSGKPHHGFNELSHALLFAWAYLEISQGANTFRRVLGVLIMLAVIKGFFTI